MTQYLLSVFYDESQELPSAEVIEQMYADVDALNAEIKDAGAWVFAGGLHPLDTATVVSTRGEETLITDGPFAETKEQIGGFWVIEAQDLDAALEWAGKATRACLSPVEVRPFQDEPPA
jgi:hypothetical protein